MKKIYTFKNLIVILFTILSSGLWAQNATVTGKVTGNNEILAGATVSSGAASSVTNEAGVYTLSLTPGSHTITASYVSFQPLSKTININAGETLTLDFTLVPGASLNEVVVTGTRAAPRTQLESPVPVDVIDIRRLAQNAPQVTVNQILNYAAPSFTSNTQSLGDGTDHIDPASLRGLGPDQVLVLINGKRRHTSSLVNVNGTFGKGSVGTDLNSIPVSAIDRIEILRDGASAQYGSDAIAGVINIILKKGVNSLQASATTGSYITKANGQNIRDGENFQGTLNFGLPIGAQGGYIDFAGTYDFRQPTDRGGTYNGIIYKRYPGAVDRTDSFLTATNTTRKDYSLKIGQSRLRSGQFMYNASVPISENAEFYSFGGLGYRNGLAYGFYRYPNDSRNVLDIYPLGFLPQIGSDINDRSIAVGIKGKLNDWNVDFSNTFGQNQFQFRVLNSLNASMLDASPTTFNSGGPKFSQNTTNADFSRGYDWLHGVNLAFGAEYRFERFQLIAGDENSWANYGSARQVGVDANNNPILVPDFFGPVNTRFGPDGTPRPGGAQVFPGFRPQNAVNATRSSIAGYADVEANFTSAFLVDAALRVEDYSDFGTTTNGKIALRYKITNRVAFRASVNTGFRAPSLHQRYFANTSTLFTNGVPYEVGIFPNDSRPAKLLGIPALRPEKSKSISAGLTGDLGKFKLSVDGYFTRINDRIVFTDQFSGSNSPTASAADQELYQLLLLANSTRAAFFANAINTETKGVDVVITYINRIGNGTLRADLSGTFSKTSRVGPVMSSDLLKGKETTYFSEASRVYLENAVPNEKANLTLNYTIKKFNVFLRNNYFGKVTEATSVIANQQVYNAKIVTDLTFGYHITRSFGISVGSNNILDVYPDKIAIAANSNSGQFVYSRSATQFGFNGRYIFARLDINL
ncbi:MAG TPA: TonB-dependent receptor [Flavisolibacter sp.]|nr:TonB-dependent receptor [Flavisolibacter sp.]